jgi:Skp family chaperone for outer membrane proteins
MNIFKKSVVGALLAASAMAVVVPAAQAQVAGIGTADEVSVIMSSNAFKTGFQQINTTFGANLNLIDTRSQEIQTLQQQLATKFDANKDQQLSPEEQQKMQVSNDPIIAQIKAKEEEMQTLELPIRAAQIFVIDTLDKNYQQAIKDVAATKKVNIVLSPDAVLWVASPDALNLNQALTTRVDQLTPTVNTTPPDPFNTRVAYWPFTNRSSRSSNSALWRRSVRPSNSRRSSNSRGLSSQRSPDSNLRHRLLAKTAVNLHGGSYRL